MPSPILIAAVLQLLLATTFVALPVAVACRGAAAQQAAEAEVARQHGPTGTLAAHRIGFAEKPWEFCLAIGIAATLTTLAVLNLAGDETGRVLSWAIEPLILVIVGFVCASQALAARHTRTAFARSADPAVRALDADAVLRAAISILPPWVQPMVLLRFGLVTLGSPVVIVLLTLPSAGDYFR